MKVQVISYFYYKDILIMVIYEIESASEIEHVYFNRSEKTPNGYVNQECLWTVLATLFIAQTVTL